MLKWFAGGVAVGTTLANASKEKPSKTATAKDPAPASNSSIPSSSAVVQYGTLGSAIIPFSQPGPIADLIHRFVFL